MLSPKHSSSIFLREEINKTKQNLDLFPQISIKLLCISESVSIMTVVWECKGDQIVPLHEKIIIFFMSNVL